MPRPIFIFVAVNMMGIGMVLSADPAAPSAKIPKDLIEKQLQAARSVFQDDLARLEIGETIFDQNVMLWSERWLDAELALSDQPADRVSALKSHVNRLKEIAALVEARARGGQGRNADTHAVRYFLISAELRLSQAAGK